MDFPTKQTSGFKKHAITQRKRVSNGGKPSGKLYPVWMVMQHSLDSLTWKGGTIDNSKATVVAYGPAQR
jgi:hypothetical protein